MCRLPVYVTMVVQVGGYRIDYKGLTFATVRNSGHMVPYVTPERAFHLLGEFLYGDRDGFDSSSTGSSRSSSYGRSSRSQVRVAAI
jgi:hypothetical protein